MLGFVESLHPANIVTLTPKRRAPTQNCLRICPPRQGSLNNAHIIPRSRANNPSFVRGCPRHSRMGSGDLSLGPERRRKMRRSRLMLVP